MATKGQSEYHFPLAVGLRDARNTARRYLIKQITVTITWMPALLGRWRCPALTAFFRAATFCGEEEFYFLAVPVYLWYFDAGNAIPLVLLFLFNLYVGNWLKNIFSLPRPPTAMRWHETPAGAGAGVGSRPEDAPVPLEPAPVSSVALPPAAPPALPEVPTKAASGAEPATGDVAESARAALKLKDVDFGWPSTHSMNAVALPFYLLRCAFPIAVWEYKEPWSMWLCGLVATLWALAVSLSRVYLGVHSPADVQGGMMLGAVLLRLWLSVHPALTALVVTGRWGLLLPTQQTPACGDTADAGAWDGAVAHAAAADASSSSHVSGDFILWVSVAAALLILAHPVVRPRTATFLESVMSVGFGYGFVVGAHLAGGNRAAASAPEHWTAGNAFACALVGGAIIAGTKVVARRAAWASVQCGPTRRLVHAALVALPLCALLRSLALVDVPIRAGALFTAMCAVVYCSEAGHSLFSAEPASPEREPPPRAGDQPEQDSAPPAEVKGRRVCAPSLDSDSVEAVVAKFVTYSSLGLALTVAVPASFIALGLRR